MHRPGQVPLRDVVAEGKARLRAEAVVGNARIGEAIDRDPRTTDAGADERGDAPPGAEIDIGVGHDDPLVLGGVVSVGADAANVGDAVGAEELRVFKRIKLQKIKIAKKRIMKLIIVAKKKLILQ